MNELLRMEHISKRFGNFYANKDISLTVNRGEVLTLLGENGAGKYKGRKPVEVNETQFKTVCAKWRAGEMTATAAMREVGLKPNTFYRRVKELGL